MVRPNADDRLRRLLAAVPWIAANDGPTVADVCTRFGYTEKELVEDLELLFMCGLYPFTPDTLIEADIADGRVFIRYAEFFARPLRLTPTEALAVVAAGAALTAVPGAAGEGPLTSGLRKLATVLGIDPDETVDVELGEAEPSVLASLQQASDQHHQVALDYYSYGRDQWSRRTIDPHRVFSSAGAWYVDGYCHAVEGDRLFRLDRMRGVERLDTTFEPRPDRATSLYQARPGDTTVTLELDASARWVAEQYPHAGLVELDGGRCRVTLQVSERPWLERLLLRLGPAATIVDGDTAVGPDAARRLLARYGTDGGSR
ncbi:MAG TPA: WYL domain-containing protein [Acidimicrobiales bacterium]|nr:WYL domain-containing protein [Acidimicrobiales bacterium]